MFRHVVLLRWVADATEEQRAFAASGLSALPSQVPEIRGYRLGPDVHLNEGNFDFAIVADFDDIDSYLVYRDHPAHVAVINDRIRPILAERAAVQHEI